MIIMLFILLYKIITLNIYKIAQESDPSTHFTQNIICHYLLCTAKLYSKHLRNIVELHQLVNNGCIKTFNNKTGIVIQSIHEFDVKKKMSLYLT